MSLHMGEYLPSLAVCEWSPCANVILLPPSQKHKVLSPNFDMLRRVPEKITMRTNSHQQHAFQLKRGGREMKQIKQ